MTSECDPLPLRRYGELPHLFLSAYNVATGERVWRFWTVPAPGEPKSETWMGTSLAKFGGGGATWMSGTYDAETDTLFWGVGNPYPAMNLRAANRCELGV